jgi:hypothetical protein
VICGVTLILVSKVSKGERNSRSAAAPEVAR